MSAAGLGGVAGRRDVVTPLGRGGADVRRRVVVLILLILCASAAVVAKLAWLQLVAPDRFAAYGEGQRSELAERTPLRGDLVDRNGEVLAMSVYRPSIVVNPTLLTPSDVREAALALSEELGLPMQDLVATMARTGTHFAYVARLVDPETAQRVRALGLPGVFVTDEPARVYPAGPALATSVIGRTTSHGEAISGLERQLDDDLTGTPGKVAWETSVYGTIPGTERVTVPPVPGTDVMLTLDRALQHQVETELVDAAGRTGAQRATAIVMDPVTGSVLAMASVDRSDDGVVRPSSANYAVQFSYEPASVMKPLTLAAAFDAGVASPSGELYVRPRLELYDQVFGDEDRSEAEMLSPTEILVRSSNVGTIELVDGLGVSGLHEALAEFGFGTTTDLGFPMEEAGRLRRDDEWDGTTIASVAIGQSMMATPLQVLLAYNALANDGEYVAPRLVLGTLDAAGDIVPAPATASRRILSAATAGVVADMMVRVVEDGTARAAGVPGYSIAAKTGTARKVIPETGTYEDLAGNRRYVATVAGFFPAESPRFSMIVVIDEPDPAQYFASDTAAPTFGSLAAWILQHYAVPPPAEWTIGGVGVAPTPVPDAVPLVRAEPAAPAGAGTSGPLEAEAEDGGGGG